MMCSVWYARFALFLCLVALSSPAQADTLDDLCDKAQARYGVRPASCQSAAAPAPLPTPTTSPKSTDDRPSAADIVESHIFFEQGGAKLSDDAHVQLMMLTSVLETRWMQSACLRLTGHSDSSGGTDANHALGLKRAEAVAAVLRQGLQNPARLEGVISVGESRPLRGIASTSPRNRRVEIQARSCR